MVLLISPAFVREGFAVAEKVYLRQVQEAVAIIDGGQTLEGFISLLPKNLSHPQAYFSGQILAPLFF